MEYIFKTKDKQEADRILNSLDMASILFELKNNFWRRWKYSEKEPTGVEVLEALQEVLSEIDIEKLIE